MAISAPTSSQNNRGGNGSFMPLRRQRRNNNNEKGRREVLQFNLEYMDAKDIRSKFYNSKDPLFVAFDYVDKQTFGDLAKEFVKDSIFDIMNFVSKVGKGI